MKSEIFWQNVHMHRAYITRLLCYRYTWNTSCVSEADCMASVSAASIKLYDICQNIYEGHFLRYFFQASRNVLFDAMRKERRIAHRNARISRNAVDRTIHRQEAQHDLEII